MRVRAHGADFTLGLIHESINTFDQSKWTRQWQVPVERSFVFLQLLRQGVELKRIMDRANVEALNRFSWANGLFGQMILDLNYRKSEILKQSFQ